MNDLKENLKKETINTEKELENLLMKAYDIVDFYSNPFVNDAGGSICCHKIKNHLEECLKILKN